MKKALVLNFFPAFYPPTSGGELRYFHFYNNLSKYMDVTLLSPTYAHHEAELIVHHQQYREYRIPKQEIHDILHMELDKEDVGVEISALVCALSANYPNAYHDKYLELYSSADILIHEFPYMLKYDLFFGLDKKPRLYNSHNHESELVKQTWTGKNAQKYIELLGNMEKELVQKADLVFATASVEVNNFVEMYGASPDRVFLAPNGITPGDFNRIVKADRTKERKSAFFIGSAHPPNLEAVQFILDSVAPNCPGIDFVIAGSCCEKIKASNLVNVSLLGLIDEKKRKELFSRADIAINPMFSGAGTNLKTLEYISAGIPLVSTEFGVRGLDLQDGVHFFRAEKETFVAILNEISQKESKIINETAAHGQKFIDMRYSWNSIVSNVLPHINEALDQAHLIKLPNILVLNDYGVAQPTAGGEIRINRLYAALSKSYHINLLCLGEQQELQRQAITEHFIQLSVPKTSKHREEDQRINSKYWISVSDIINSYMVKENELLGKMYNHLYKAADIIIATHPYMMNLVDNPDNKPFIYESHNTEYELKKELLQGHPLYDQLIKEVITIEKSAVNKSKFIISVSDTDHSNLLKLASDQTTQIYTINNGVDIKYNKYDTEPVKRLLSGYPGIVFVGSAHPPNIESAKYIVEHLAPKINAYFLIIGSVCEALSGGLPDNVILLGRISDIQKDYIMQMAEVALNPMMSGSGSNLKLADYMSHSLAVVTTPIGKRGYDIKSGDQAIICDLELFEEQINNLISMPELRRAIGKKAFSFVKNTLDWKALARELDTIIQNDIIQNKKKRLLFITYRFTNPPLGGAETYLIKVIEQLDRSGEFQIDIVTLDIGYLYNKHHFSIDYTTEPEFDDSIYKHTSVHKFSVNSLEEKTIYENSKMLFKQWMKESGELSLHFKSVYQNPLLLGGWHYPERHNDTYSVWSSEESYLYIGQEIDSVIIQAESPLKRLLTIKTEDNSVVYQQKVSGAFSVELKELNTLTLSLSIAPYIVEGQDPRGLGVRVNSVQIKKKNKDSSQLRLDYNYKNYLKETALEPFIEQMIKQAQGREVKWELLFQETRGPVSDEMNEWLQERIKDADLVFGHSVPFNTFVLASELADKNKKPLVLLPHFHMEDEYYHWRFFYDSMRKADRVLAFPHASIPLFHNKIQANALDLPGGAIEPSEYNQIDSSKFRRKFDSELPFVLVLGRKSRSKNYHVVMEAIEKVNIHSHRCNLVIIGKDEDGDRIQQEHVYYLGELSRDEVMGALKECCILVTMSDSESFGIVILEAWMLKKPVIVNGNCAAFAELVDHDKNGYLSDKEQLDRYIGDLLDNPARVISMGESGFQKVSNKYTWDSIGNELKRLFLELTAR